VARIDGYAPIADYALIGDGRTGALVARDGAIDWLCTPNFDSDAVFAALIDAERGGSFRVGPAEPAEIERRYEVGTNVLETTYRTGAGSVRVIDAMCLTGDRISPMRELVRRVESLEGTVRLDVLFEPRFGFGSRSARFRTTAGRIVASAGPDAVALDVHGGELQADSTLTLAAGETALLALSLSSKEPLVFSSRDDIERRLERTRSFWRSWSDRAEYEGRWRDAVVRSALALKLLVFAPSGAVVAAPTTSLPEEIGGVRNWDYRFAWLRDANWTLDALLQLGYTDEAKSFLWWFMHATRLTHPRLEVLYGLDGSRRSNERDLDLAGYRGSRPVRVGNGAAGQLQLDIYGAVLQGAWLYASSGGELDRATAKDVAKLADWVANNWRRPDAGIWEIRSPPQHFVHSKAFLWIALDRACRMADRGLIPDGRERWEPAAQDIRAFVEESGFDAELRSYIRAPAMREVDASILTLPLCDWAEPGGERMRSTIDRVREDLGAGGPLLYRYRGSDGVPGGQGAFVACSFWLVDALARIGRLHEAVELMDELIGLANDVGLYAEEIDPGSGAFLGNFPQALTHLALINAAVTIERAESQV
jgi:GH15 family glucan-1,4-alpha-glucosidase